MKILVTIIILHFSLLLNAQERTWRNYQYPFLGVDYSLPYCGFTDEDDCIGIGLLNELELDELTIVVGIINKENEEYTDEHPFPYTKTSTGKLPKYTLKNYPNLTARKPETYIFYDNESYCLRYYFSLRNNYVLKLEIEGFYEEFENDNTQIKRLLDNIRFYTPQSRLDNKALSQYKLGPLEGKASCQFLQFEDADEGFTPSLKMDERGQMYLLWISKSKGVVLSQLSPEGSHLKDIELGFDKTYYHFELIHDGFALIGSMDRYLGKTNKKPRYYREHLFVEAYHNNGKLLWKTTLSPEIVITKSGDKGFTYTRGGCVSLASSGDHLLAYYPVNGKFDDGIVHQGDAIKVLDIKGNLLETYTNNWYVSHSFAQQSVFDGKKFHLYALGDAYPRGINYTNLSLHQTHPHYKKHNIFPFAGLIGDNYVGDTEFSNIIYNDHYTYLAISTEENVKSKNSKKSARENDIVLICIDKKGHKVFEKNITNTPEISEAYPSICFYNNQILVTWKQDEYYVDLKHTFPESFMLVDADGSKTSEQVPLVSYSAVKMRQWHDMGNDLMTAELPSMSNFVRANDGSIYFIRFMPYFLSNYMELVKIQK